MAEIPVDPRGAVKIRGIPFPVQCIKEAMLETGGKVVSDPRIIKELDKAMAAMGNREAEFMMIEAIPLTVFIPRKIRLHRFLGDPGKESDFYLYFAVEKRTFHA